MDKIKSISLYIFFGLLGYMPLHIFLSTWIGASLGVLGLAKILKDIVLAVGFGLVLIVSVRQPWFKNFIKDKLVWLISVYALLTLLLAALIDTDLDAEILGIVYNIRFLLFFLYGWLLTRLFADKNLQVNAIKLIVAVSVPVLVFGVVQYLWLPDSALTHVGYGRENGVLPAFFIDEKPDLERVMSTLRDPNSFGSYLIIILSISLVAVLQTRNKDVRKFAGGLTALAVLCLYFTFSRSAWIGALLAILCVGMFMVRKHRVKMRKPLLATFGVILILVAGGLYVARDSYFVKNVILHADESTVLEDPNQLRLRFWRESAESAINQPMGYGPGTAGLASIRNDERVVLNENYYLQILHEVGVLGLMVFVAILALVVKRFYELAHGNWVAIALLAAFVGLAFTNFLVHIWSNEAVAYTWWGLAGLFTSRGNSHNKKGVAN